MGPLLEEIAGLIEGILTIGFRPKMKPLFLGGDTWPGGVGWPAMNFVASKTCATINFEILQIRLMFLRQGVHLLPYLLLPINVLKQDNRVATKHMQQKKGPRTSWAFSPKKTCFFNQTLYKFIILVDFEVALGLSSIVLLCCGCSSFRIKIHVFLAWLQEILGGPPKLDLFWYHGQPLPFFVPCPL